MISALEDVWRREAPHVLGAVVRRYGDFGYAEDAVQEALLSASQQWPRDGLPDDPRAWLIQVAARRAIDRRRSEGARSAREHADAAARMHESAGNDPAVISRDDTLTLFLLCCHPALRRAAQVPLTLRAVGGLTTAQIAAGLLLPERTVAQRITRAKAVLREQAVPFEPPSSAQLPARVATVLEVLVLIFNEGYTTSAGDRLVDVALADEAIRLLRELHRRLPSHDEVTGALALTLLTHARAAARTDAAGDLVPLAEQDRTKWDAGMLREGVALVEQVLPRGPVGPLQLQAAIAAVHADASDAAATDWTQIAELYRMLDARAPGPMVTMNLAVAEAMAGSPADGLARLATLAGEPAMQNHHRLFAVRAHLREQDGDVGGAVADYARAARLTRSMPEQRYLNRCAARLTREGQG